MADTTKTYFKDIKNIPLLTSAEEVELANRVRRGDRHAKDKMIKANLRLVINFAKRYRHLGIPLMDLIEEGNMGLIKAVSKFNPKKGFRFSTYASWWIRQYILRALANQGKIVRLPVYMVENILRQKKAAEGLAYKLQRKPTTLEVAKKLNMTQKKVEEIENFITSIMSLEAPIGEERLITVADVIEDESAVSAQTQLSEFLAREKMYELLNRMTPRERRILELRYGLKGQDNLTLQATAKIFKLTRERIRQIEKAALKKLKKMAQKEEKVLKPCSVKS